MYATTIVGGNSGPLMVESRIESLKEQIKQTDSMSECERIQGRITRLSSGVGVIRVGGSTEVEMIEKKHRIEDALEAVRSALEEGIVGGGGTSLARAAQQIAITSDNPEQAYGTSVIQVACQEPLRQMSINAGESPDLIVERVLSSENNMMGWNFRTGQMVNLFESGVIDPVKVTRTALQNAASCAGTLITTNFGIIQTETD
jgi:chaperonin GroEL